VLDVEYNAGIDLVAAQVVFNESDLNVWQIPRDAYRQVLASRSELVDRMASSGPLGARLFDAICSAVVQIHRLGLNLGETYILGDSPLVLATALLSSFDADASSSRWAVRPRPRIDNLGNYRQNPDAQEMRIFTQLDSRLLLEHLYAKLRSHDARFARGDLRD
jgi:inosine-uridine nucleoside N-ribohydrolase